MLFLTALLGLLLGPWRCALHTGAALGGRLTTPAVTTPLATETAQDPRHLMTLGAKRISGRNRGCSSPSQVGSGLPCTWAPSPILGDPQGKGCPQPGLQPSPLQDHTGPPGPMPPPPLPNPAHA